MEITLIIVGGLVAMTALAGLFDFLGKKRTGRDPRMDARVEKLERRQEALENALSERDARIEELGREVSFMSRMLDDGGGQRGRSLPG